MMNAATARSRSAYWLPAVLGEHRVMLIDYSAEGLLLEHYRELPVDIQAVFLIEWEGQRVAVICRVVQCEKFPVSWGSEFCVYRTSVLFIDGGADLERKLDRLIDARHQVSIALQMANASGQVPPRPHPTFRNGLVAIEQLGALRATEYMRMTWDGRRWTALCTTDARQPAEGFTVSADEPAQQIQRLCEAYEQSTAEGRILIRAQARISVDGTRKRPRRGH